METLLTQIQTRNISDLNNDGAHLLPLATKRDQPEKTKVSLNGPEDALDTLRSKPDHQELNRVLRWLKSTVDHREGFNIKMPSPKASEIIYVLINDIIPIYWVPKNGSTAFNQSREENLLLYCLSCVAGLGAIISCLRLLLRQLKDPRGQSVVSGTRKTQPVELLLDLLEAILGNNGFVTSIWNDINACILQPSHKSLQWKEFISLVASGKVLSTASEATAILNNLESSVSTGSWVGDGHQYVAWLGGNVQHMLGTLMAGDLEGLKTLSQLLRKALTLGYIDQIVETSCMDLISGDDKYLDKYRYILAGLSAHEQKVLFYSLIRALSKRHLSVLNSSQNNGNLEAKARGGVAALLVAFTQSTPVLQDLLVDWLVGTSAEAVNYNHNTHRAVVAALSLENDQVMRALQSNLGLLGDKLYIKHTPILHQEVNAQTSLMLVGYSSRQNSKALVDLSRSSVYLNAISNRLAASSQRARFLGMVLGNAVSELIDAKDKRMVFTAEELNSSDGQWYTNLTKIHDAIGLIKDLKPVEASSAKSLGKRSRPVTNSAKSTQLTKPPNASSRIISIEEINDSSGSESEDLPMYEKPDSDPSDEDEDPTLVQRNKPTAPVYIRDLIAGLRHTENFDRHKLALNTASSLIRRKAAFGSEVSDNIEELATILVGLGDKWEMENFQQKRLQGMIAVLTASPLKMGQWFSMTFYNGDYSMGQRASILTTLGLGARELARLGQEDAVLTGANAIAQNPFPSKRLPDKLHKLYALEAAPMNTLSQQLERTMIQPIAAEAADKVTGPNALKVRTFSSRMAVEKKRQRPIPNALAKIVAEGFFFPLTGRWRIHLQAYGDTSSHTSPFLLTHFLKTLSLILHASGSSTLSLPQMTSEFWDLLLSLRPRATDPAVLEALLFAFLTLLDINGNDQRRVAEEHAKELLETQGWVEGVFERIGGGSEEGERIRMLAAGVLVRCREVVERYQRLLMGDIVDFI